MKRRKLIKSAGAVGLGAAVGTETRRVEAQSDSGSPLTEEWRINLNDLKPGDEWRISYKALQEERGWFIFTVIPQDYERSEGAAYVVDNSTGEIVEEFELSKRYNVASDDSQNGVVFLYGGGSIVKIDITNSDTETVFNTSEGRISQPRDVKEDIIFTTGDYDEDNTLYRFDPYNSEVVWQRSLGNIGKYRVEQREDSESGYIYLTKSVSSPSESGPNVNSYDGSVMCLNSENGETVWENVLFENIDALYTLGRSFTTNGNEIYVNTEGGENGWNPRIYKLSSTGELLWSKEMELEDDAQVGFLDVSYEAGVVGIDVERNPSDTEPTTTELLFFDADSGEELWTNEITHDTETTFLGLQLNLWGGGDYAYVDQPVDGDTEEWEGELTDDSENLRWFNARTGELVGQFDQRITSSTASFWTEDIYLGSGENVYALQKENGESIWTHDIGELVEEIQAIRDTYMYVRSPQSLYALSGLPTEGEEGGGQAQIESDAPGAGEPGSGGNIPLPSWMPLVSSMPMWTPLIGGGLLAGGFGAWWLSQNGGTVTGGTTTGPTGGSSSSSSGTSTTQPSGEGAETTEQPSEDAGGDTTDQSSEDTSTDTTDQPSEGPPSDTTDQPTQDPSSGTTDQPSEDPTQETTEQPNQDPSSDTTDQPSDDPTTNTTDQPSEDTSTETTDQPTQDPSGDTTHQPSEDTSTDTTDQPTQDPTGDMTDQPSEDPTETGTDTDTETPPAVPPSHQSQTPDKPDEEHGEQDSESNVKYCPECGQELPKEAKFCSSCGADASR